MAKAQADDRVDPFHRAGLVESQRAALLKTKERNIDDASDVKRQGARNIPIAKAGIGVEGGERVSGATLSPTRDFITRPRFADDKRRDRETPILADR